jgi:signal transduction histidine kinase
MKMPEKESQLGLGEASMELGLELDPEAAALRRRQRERDLHLRQVPRLRLFGFVLLSVGVVLHNQLILGSVSWPSVSLFAGIALSYSLVSWLVLRLFFERVRIVNLGDLFLGLDIVCYVLAVYFTGGERSWAFFILLIRVIDQVVTSVRRTLIFAHLNVLGLLLLVVYLDAGEGRAISWSTELAKALFLYLTALYIAAAARPSERRRRRAAMAVRTARKLIEQLKVARAKAEAASTAKSVFLSTMSHEYRTPMNAIIGVSELLDRTPLDQVQKRYVETLRSSADSLLGMLSDILDFAAVDTGQLEVEKRPFDLVAAIDRVLVPVAARAKAKDLQLESRCDPELPAEVVGDPMRLGQVLSHLLGNAIKFTWEGGVSLDVRPVREDCSGLSIRFEVCDSGIGFAMEDLERLLEPFIQADGSTTRRYGGSGIGLAVAKGVVEAMGGTFGAESSPGHGSTFWFVLPVGTTDLEGA